MLSKQKVYDSSELNIESHFLCFKFDKNYHQTKKTYLDNTLNIKQLSTESKINREQECPNHQSYQNGRWTNEENQRFIEALFIYGTDWKRVQNYIQTRTSIQSRSHAQKFFITFNKLFKEVYGKDNKELESSPLKAQYILNILSKMNNCQFITALCDHLPSLLNESNLASLKGDLSLDDKANKLKTINTSFIKRTIEEKGHNFIKVIYALMKVSSRTKNHSNKKKMTNGCNDNRNQDKESAIDQKQKKGLDHGSINRIDGDEATSVPNQISDSKSETNGTGPDCLETPWNMALSLEEPFHFISFDDFDYVLEGQFIQDNILDFEIPFFFGQGK